MTQTTVETIRDAVEEALAMLGTAETADQVAAMLADAGCLAFSWPYLRCYCPVTRWLWDHVPWEPEDGMRIQVGTSSVHADGQVMLLPRAVRLFVRNYDDGLYKHLVDDPKRLWV